VTWASVLSLDRSEPALARVPFTHTPPFRHNGMGHALCRGVDCFRIHRPRGWSVYGAQQAQPVASTGKSAGRRNRVKQAKTVAVGCDWLPRASNGKEGVDGSSPSEGSAKPPHDGASCFGSICRFSNVGQVWSPYGAFRSKTRSWRAALRATVRRQRRFGAPQLPRSGCSAGRTRPASLTTQPRRAVARRPSVCGRPTA
jgi:hypothetical protein